MDSVALDAAYADALRRLDAMAQALATPAPPTVATIASAPPRPAESRTPPGEYQPAVEQALEAVRAGEVFQIQVGQRFRVETDADPLDVYRVLRTLNPSPYMYFLRTGRRGHRRLQPGGPGHGRRPTERCCTRSPGPGSRGETAERDAALAAELVSRPEGAGRARDARRPRPQRPRPGGSSRDGARWSSSAPSSDTAMCGTSCRPSRRPGRRHGRVRRADRDVSGGDAHRRAEGARDGADRRAGAGAPWRVWRSGRLSRRSRRPGHGDRDPHRGHARRAAYVQASAGIVADSVPALEELETRNKARAVLQAIATAETLRPVARP